jgi:hypothetical protein
MKIQSNERAAQVGAVAQSLPEAKKTLTKHATDATVTAIVEKNPKHPLLAKFGEALGLGLGVLVTEALALVPSWNKPLRDAQGKPVREIPGATQQGDYELRKRHEEVVGPKVAKLVDKLEPGLVHDLLAGFARGATAAPGTSYRLEADVAEHVKKGW